MPNKPEQDKPNNNVKIYKPSTPISPYHRRCLQSDISTSNVSGGFKQPPIKLPPDELKDKYFNLAEENLKLKKTVNDQTNTLRKLQTQVQRLEELSRSKKTSPSNNQQFKEHISHVENENKFLRERVRVLKQQLQSHSRLHAAAHRPTNSTVNGKKVSRPPTRMRADSASSDGETDAGEKSVLDSMGAMKMADENQQQNNDNIPQEYDINPLEEIEEKAIVEGNLNKVAENIELIRLRRLLKRQAAQLLAITAQADCAEKEIQSLREELQTASAENEHLSQLLNTERQKVQDMMIELAHSASIKQDVRVLEEEVRDLKQERLQLKDHNEKLLKLAANKSNSEIPTEQVLYTDPEPDSSNNSAANEGLPSTSSPEDALHSKDNLKLRKYSRRGVKFKRKYRPAIYSSKAYKNVKHFQDKSTSPCCEHELHNLQEHRGIASFRPLQSGRAVPFTNLNKSGDLYLCPNCLENRNHKLFCDDHVINVVYYKRVMDSRSDSNLSCSMCELQSDKTTSSDTQLQENYTSNRKPKRPSKELCFHTCPDFKSSYQSEIYDDDLDKFIRSHNDIKLNKTTQTCVTSEASTNTYISSFQKIYNSSSGSDGLVKSRRIYKVNTKANQIFQSVPAEVINNKNSQFSSNRDIKRNSKDDRNQFLRKGETYDHVKPNKKSPIANMSARTTEKINKKLDTVPKKEFALKNKKIDGPSKVDQGLQTIETSDANTNTSLCCLKTLSVPEDAVGQMSSPDKQNFNKTVVPQKLHACTNTSECSVTNVGNSRSSSLEETMLYSEEYIEDVNTSKIDSLFDAMDENDSKQYEDETNRIYSHSIFEKISNTTSKEESVSVKGKLSTESSYIVTSGSGDSYETITSTSDSTLKFMLFHPNVITAISISNSDSSFETAATIATKSSQYDILPLDIYASCTSATSSLQEILSTLETNYKQVIRYKPQNILPKYILLLEAVDMMLSLSGIKERLKFRSVSLLLEIRLNSFNKERLQELHKHLHELVIS